jgi:transposase
MPVAATSALRRQVLRRANLVRQRTRLKNQVQAAYALMISKPARRSSRYASSPRADYNPGRGQGHDRRHRPPAE